MVLRSRLDHIDIAKGIGILLVIGLHTNVHPDFGVAFEMPLFFLLSGIFVNVNKAGFIIKKINSIMIPAIIYYLPLFFYNIYYAVVNNISIRLSFVNSSIPSAEWFLLSLFELHIIYFIISKLIKSLKIQFCIFIILSIIGYILSYFSIKSIAFINTSLSCSLYYFLGLFFSSKLKEINKIKPLQALLLSTLLFTVCASLYYYFKPEIFYRNNILNANYFLIISTAISGTIGTILISCIISRVKILNTIFVFYGRNSLIILCTHLYVMKICEIFISNQFIIFITIILIMIPLCWFINKFLPIANGSSSIIK